MPAAPSLHAVFERRADGASRADRPLVGVFGAGVPELLIAAHGGQAIDVKAPPLADATEGPIAGAVEAVTEPFMDAFALRFLHRFAAGAFDAFALIVFARDDVAGLAAYQYACELRRQGRVPDTGPRLHLWNLVHSATPAAEAFNCSEFARLDTLLQRILGATADASALEAALAAEAARHAALGRLPAGGAPAFIARAAGRWLTPAAHLPLLDGLALTRELDGAARIVLAGTACDIPVMHELCTGLGRVDADLQDYARRPALPDRAEPAAILRALAGDPLHIRAMPPGRMTAALRDGVADADLVIVTVDPNDDSFGWELPGLRAAVEARGGRFLDLGFRPFRPDADWRAQARGRLEEALS